jgi:hypothetical protein
MYNITTMEQIQNPITKPYSF